MFIWQIDNFEYIIFLLLKISLKIMTKVLLKLAENPAPIEENTESFINSEDEKEKIEYSRLSFAIQNLIKEYKEGLKEKKEETSTLHVDEIASKVARLYEKIRKIIDWKEENLLRRNAIERILKRVLITEISSFNPFFKIKVEEISEPLILELIRGGHLPNHKIPESKTALVAQTLNKYLYLLKNAPLEKTKSLALKTKVNFYNWILEIAACEIEEILAPPFKENALINAMSQTMVEKIKVIPEEKLSPEEKFIQTYIAVHRTLFDLDDAIISYHLLQFKYKNWNSYEKQSWETLAQNILSIREEINQNLNHPLGKDFFNICEQTDTPFTLLGDILDYFRLEPNQIESILSNKEDFKKLIAYFYNQRLLTLKSRLFKIAVFSTLSVFVSNWFTFFIVEIPIANLFYEGFSPFAAAIDFIVPSLAMFILVSLIRPPSSNNLEKVIEMTSSFTFQNEKKEIYEIKPKKRKNILTQIAIYLFYILSCVISFGAIAWAFYLATIPITSVILDTIGIALNVFAALVIRNKAKEITVEEKGSFWEFLIDIFSLPVAEIGSWLANKWKEYNIVSVFFNVFIEIPFVSAIEFVENWRSFLKEKKASIH